MALNYVNKGKKMTKRVRDLITLLDNIKYVS